MAETRRRMPGGAYVMDNKSFGAMMVSEQCRNALNAYSTAIKEQARANTNRSTPQSTRKRRSKKPRRSGPSLADSYEVVRGPNVTLIVDGRPSPRISNRVVNRLRHAAAHEFGVGGWQAGNGSRDLRRAGQSFGDLAGERG